MLDSRYQTMVSSANHSVNIEHCMTLLINIVTAVALQSLEVDHVK